MDKTVFPDEPSLWMCIDEAAVKFDLPDLQLAIDNYLRCTNHSSGRQVEVPSSSKRIQVWTKVQVQQPNYHNRSSVEPPQSLSVSPPHQSVSQVVVMILLLSVIQTKVIGHQVVSKVCFTVRYFRYPSLHRTYCCPTLYYLLSPLE